MKQAIKEGDLFIIRRENKHYPYSTVYLHDSLNPLLTNKSIQVSIDSIGIILNGEPEVYVTGKIEHFYYKVLVENKVGYLHGGYIEIIENNGKNGNK